jgi:hypothetical protein
MNDTEIGALRQKLASRVRSDDYRQRRKDMDSRSLGYKIAPDVTRACLAPENAAQHGANVTNR